MVTFQILTIVLLLVLVAGLVIRMIEGERQRVAKWDATQSHADAADYVA